MVKFSIFDIEYADLLHEVQDIYGLTDEEIEDLKKKADESKKKLQRVLEENAND